MTKRLLSPTTDRASDILGVGHDPLQPVFAPRSVAVIGVSDRPGSVGRTLLRNLISTPFGGTVYPVKLVGLGRDEGLVRISGDTLASNAGMLRVSQRAGFTVRRDPQTATVEATLSL